MTTTTTPEWPRVPDSFNTQDTRKDTNNCLSVVPIVMYSVQCVGQDEMSEENGGTIATTTRSSEILLFSLFFEKNQLKVYWSNFSLRQLLTASFLFQQIGFNINNNEKVKEILSPSPHDMSLFCLDARERRARFSQFKTSDRHDRRERREQREIEAVFTTVPLFIFSRQWILQQQSKRTTTVLKKIAAWSSLYCASSA